MIRLLDISSQHPWLEAVLLKAGIGHITTLEYLEVEAEDPRITTILPGDFAKKFL